MLVDSAMLSTDATTLAANGLATSAEHVSNGLHEAGRGSDGLDEHETETSRGVLGGEVEGDVGAGALAHAHDLRDLELVEDRDQAFAELLKRRVLLRLEVRRLGLLTWKVNVQPDHPVADAFHLLVVD